MTPDGQRLEHLRASLTNHSPGPVAVGRIEEIRRYAKDLGTQIILDAPDSRERALALTHLEEAVMWAVKAIVLEDYYATEVGESLSQAMRDQ